MNESYSNFKATMAIAKASLRSILRSPSSVVFTLLFPLIFILVFGFIGGNTVSVDVGIAKNSDTHNPLFDSLKKVSVINMIQTQSASEMQDNLKKGHIDAILNIQKHITAPYLTVDVTYTQASQEKGSILQSVLMKMFYRINQATRTAYAPPPVAELKENTVKGREYKTIDFILPGQLGFALLSTGVFGTAFVFLSLRIQLVIKRFFATPVKRYSIVIGEALARITFALVGAAFILIIGRFAFGFTLIHGITTFINMLILSFIGVLIFMGFGFAVSGVAKNESTVPPIANLITLPQFLLSGTFFTINAFPHWLQPFCRVLPLTFLNDAMRKVAFEGASLLDVGTQLLYLGIWGIVIYALAVKLFKWE